MKKQYSLLKGFALFAILSVLPLMSEAQTASVKTLTILGGYGQPGEVHPYTESSRDGGQTWGPAYLFVGHPWGNIAGTNSWVNFNPSPFVGLYQTTLYRIRFVLPDVYTDPHMSWVGIADNYGEMKINGAHFASFAGYTSANVPDAFVQQNLHPGLNEITLSLTDWGGWVGLNYRVDISMVTEDDPVILDVNTDPVADAGDDQVFNCAPPEGLEVVLDGSGSSDADDDQLSYFWTWENGTLEGPNPIVHVPGGSYVFILEVNDGNEGITHDEVLITVHADTERPAFGLVNPVFQNNDPRFFGATVALSVPDVTDNCGVLSVEGDAPAFFPVGTTVVTWTAKDVHGNVSVLEQEVTVVDTEDPLSVEGFTSDFNGYGVSCYASTNGAITLTATGGHPGDGDYTYNWSDGATTKDRSGLGAGVYTVTVSDPDGHYAEMSFEISEPDPLAADPIEGGMVFLGYGPAESATLVGNPASGGVAPYIYEWYDASGALMGTGLEATFSPKETSIYNLIITDANACQLIVEGTVCAVDISCTAGNGKGKGNSGNKVSVCHIPEGNPSNQHTICVSVNAVASHLAAGDLLGPCGTPQLCDGSFKSGSLDANPGVFSSDFVFSLYPNPAQDYANVVFNVEDDCRLQVTLNDLSGKVLETIYDNSAIAGQEYQSQIDLQNIPQGIYMVRMVSDKGLISVLRLSVL